MKEGWLQAMCYLYRGAIASDMSADPVPLLDVLKNPLLTESQVRLVGQF